MAVHDLVTSFYAFLLALRHLTKTAPSWLNGVLLCFLLINSALLLKGEGSCVADPLKYAAVIDVLAGLFCCYKYGGFGPACSCTVFAAQMGGHGRGCCGLLCT